MARRTNEEYKKLKQRLLEVGLALFEEKGYNATGLQEITAAAKISKGSFYTYFSSKSSFGVCVIRYYTENSLKNWSEMIEEATLKEDAYGALSKTLFKISNQYKDVEIKKGCLLGNLAAEISETNEECRLELYESINRYKAILTKHIVIGQSMGKVRTDIPGENLAELIWDVWQGSLLRMKIEKSVKPVTTDLGLIFKSILKN